MTQTTFTDNVVIEGSQDITQLAVQGHTTQTEPLQTWQDSGATPLAQVAPDGRYQTGDMGLGTADALVEANADITLPSSRPQRAIQSLGRLTGALASAVAWAVHELELLGAGGVSALQTALHARLSHQNSGDSSNAALRAGDFQVINRTGTVESAVGQATGVRGTASNTPLSEGEAYLAKAVGVEAALTNDTDGTIAEAAAFEVAPPTNGGVIETLYGVRVPDLTEGQTNYAIHTGQGLAHFGDAQELKVRSAAPTANPPNAFIHLYPRLSAGTPRLFAKDAAGIEHDLGSQAAAGETFGYWDWDKAPEDPSALDDEFNGVALDAKWTQVNWSGLAAHAVNDRKQSALWLQSETPATTLLRSILQPLPSGDFTAFTRVVWGQWTEDYFNQELILTDGTSDGSGSQAVLSIGQDGGLNVLAQEYTDFDTYDSDLVSAVAWLLPYAVLRLMRIDSDYFFAVSEDGATWRALGSSGLSFTPTHIGLFVNHERGTASAVETSFEFFRFRPVATATTGELRVVAPNAAAFVYRDPDKPPALPSVLDDEFNGTALDAKWTQVNWSGLIAYDVNGRKQGALWLANPATGSEVLRCLLQGLPSGDFTVFTRVAVGQDIGEYFKHGLVLSDSDSENSGNQALFYVGENLTQVKVQEATNFNGGFSTVAGPGTWDLPYAFLRLRRSGSDYFFSVSADGATWRDEFAVELSFTPNHLGLFVDASSMDVEVLEVSFAFFRYFNNPTTYTTGGQRKVGPNSQPFAYHDWDKAPVFPSPLDDEFSQPGLDTKWTQVNWSGLDDYTVDATRRGALWILNSATSGDVLRTILQPLPSGDFTAFTRVVWGQRSTDALKQGILLSDANSAASGNQAAFFIGAHTGGRKVHAEAFTGFTTYSSALMTAEEWQLPYAFLRVSRIADDYFLSISEDGTTWREPWPVSLSFTPTHLGLFVDATGGTVETAFDFFRYVATSVATTGGLRTVDPGPGYPQHTTLWHDESQVVAGSPLSQTLTANQMYGGYSAQSPAADGDSFIQPLFLAAGSYALHVIGVADDDRGQIDWYLDDSLIVAAQDWYAAATDYNVDQTASISIPLGGPYTLTGVVNGKHASSSDFTIALTKVYLVAQLDN
jgi:hypothetical protein